MTAATLAILLHSVLLQVLQVTLNPGVAGVGTDLAALLCDEHDGRMGAASAGAVITLDELLWELVACVREAADREVGSSWARGSLGARGCNEQKSKNGCRGLHLPLG